MNAVTAQFNAEESVSLEKTLHDIRDSVAARARRCNASPRVPHAR